MSVSVIVNTCALGEDGARRSSKGHGPTYAERASKLRDLILPKLISDPDVSEVIVVGEWEEGEDYRYVHARGPDSNVWDQCFQKAAAKPSSPIAVYLCDDHLPDKRFFKRISSFWVSNLLWDVLSPMRLVNGRSINVGWNDGYIHAHGVVLRHDDPQHLWEETWKRVRGTWGFDVPMTEMWLQGGLHIQTDPLLLLHDIEDNTYEYGS